MAGILAYHVPDDCTFLYNQYGSSYEKNFLMVFDQIVALTNGGPGRATESISLLIYKGGFSGGEFAYQSANSVVYFIIIVVISVLQIRFFLQKNERWICNEQTRKLACNYIDCSRILSDFVPVVYRGYDCHQVTI
ncbi:hypothetical protein GCM10020331_014540 [Ectobacillus funiculus]